MPDRSFSVIVPTYNRTSCVAEAIESILQQTLPAAEIIVVDDGSTDQTEQTLSAFGQKIRYVKKTNGGVSSARNRGLEEATGEWITFLDSDDLWKPRYLEVQAESIARSPSALVHLTNLEFVSNQRPASDHFSQFGLTHQLGPKSFAVLPRPLRYVLANQLYNFQAAAVHRSLFERFGKFRQDLSNGEDLDCMARFALQTPFSVTREPLAQVLHRPGESLTGEAKKKGVTNCRIYDELFLRIENQPEIDRAERAVVRRLRSMKKRQLGNLLLRENNYAGARRAFREGFTLHPAPASFVKYLASFLPPAARLLDRHGKDVQAG